MRISFSSVVVSLLALFALTAGTEVSSSPSPQGAMLKLGATVKDVRMLEEDRYGIRFGLKLGLTFVNESNETALLLKDNFVVGATLLARTCEDARVEKYVHQMRSWPSVSNAPEWASWREKLDKPAPPAELVWVMGPGKSVTSEAEAMIFIEKRGNFDGTNKPWDEIRQAATVCLQVEVKAWPSNLEPKHGRDKLDFGHSLQRRWLTIGRLELEHLRSEPVQMSFPPDHQQ